LRKNILFSSFFWAAGIAVFLTTFASAETQKLKVIKEIQIQGAKNYKERAVRELVKTRPKDFYAESALREDVQSILASGNYDDAEVETVDLPVGIRVVFKVKEKPVVKKMDFTGNKKLGKSKLKDDLTLKLKEGFDPIKLRNDVQKIKDLYGEKGYPDASIEPFTTFNEKDNQVAINFVIKEGNRVLIERVDFEGITAFTAKKLRKVIKTKRKKVFDLEKLNKDKEELANFYKNNGYARVEIGEHRLEYNADRTRITLTLPVKEGARYVTGTFEFVGNSVYKEEELRKAVEMKQGQLFKQEKYEASLRNLKELYLEKGYLYSRVEPEELPDEPAQKMNYKIHIDEGGIVYIDRVFIEGNKKTKEKVFRREILLKPGDPFSSSKLRRSQEKIFNLGFIDDVKPDIQPARDPDKADLVMEIVEGKPGSLSAGAGYSSNDGLVGQLQLSHGNLFGLAQRLNLMWEFGARRQNYELNWTEPWLLDRPVSFGIDLYNTIRERLFDSDSDPDYTETRSGGGVRIGPRFSDIYSLNFSYAYNRIKINNVKQQFLSQIPEATNNTSAFSMELVRDTRDYYFDATRGMRNSIYTQFMGGPVLQGDTNLVKSILSTSWFFTTFSIGNYPFVFSMNGRVGAAQEYKPSDTVPLFERFYVGGADSIRGYNSRGEIGPVEGGRIFSVFNAEYKIPLYVENKRRILQFVLFADAGGAWKGAPDVLLKFGQSSSQDIYGRYSDNERYLKSSVGMGIRITTPVFPIRLDWGYGLNHRPGEDISQIHFTLGNLF
jgi:outer membrane protein insertion porin family